MGNPIDSPALNVTNRLERLFNGEGALAGLARSSGKGRQHLTCFCHGVCRAVMPGGRLDLRSIILYRGKSAIGAYLLT